MLARPSIAALLLLAACATTTAPVTRTVPYALRGPAAAEIVQGSDAFIARAYLQTPSGRSEISGLPCTLESGLFSSSFTAPAKVLTPRFGARVPDAQVSCTYQGVTRSVALRPLATTRGVLARPTAYVGLGTGDRRVRTGLGIALGAGTLGTAATSRGYADTEVTFAAP